jgi:hypothetical protein
MANDDYSRDPDALDDDMVVARIQVVCRKDGALGVSGSINNLPYALAMLDNAKDAIKRHHLRMGLGKQIITPAYDSPILDIPDKVIT